MLILQIVLDASQGSPCKVAPLEKIGTNSIHKFSLQTLYIAHCSSEENVCIYQLKISTFLRVISLSLVANMCVNVDSSTDLLFAAVMNIFWSTCCLSVRQWMT